MTAVRSRRSALGQPGGPAAGASGRQAALHGHCLDVVPTLLEMREAGSRRPEWNRSQVDRLLKWYQQTSLNCTAPAPEVKNAGTGAAAARCWMVSITGDAVLQCMTSLKRLPQRLIRLQTTGT